MRTTLVLCVALLVASGSRVSPATPPPANDALLAALHDVDPEIRQTTTHLRIDAGDSDLLLASATTGGEIYEVRAGEFWWDASSILALTKQEKASGKLQMLTTVRRNDMGFCCTTRILRATPDEIVLARTYGDKGGSAPHVKLFIDLRAGTVRTAEFAPFPIQKVQLEAGVPHFVAGDETQFLVIRATSTAPFLELLSGVAAAPIVSALRIDVSTVGRDRREIRTVDNPRAELRFGPDKRFRWDPHHPDRVFEATSDGDKEFPLPQSTQQEWVKARPYAADKTETRSPADTHGFSCSSCQPEESIGSPQVVGSRLWFGKSFIDGEGSTGVGGVGYFETRTRKFNMIPIPEMKDHSVSALLVEGQVMWVGLFYNSSCSGDWAGGLLRIDLASRRVHRYELPAIVSSIVRYEDRLYVASSDGITVIPRGGKPEHYFVDKSRDGSFQMSK
jgi:hypothetical protein